MRPVASISSLRHCTVGYLIARRVPVLLPQGSLLVTRRVFLGKVKLRVADLSVRWMYCDPCYCVCVLSERWCICVFLGAVAVSLVRPCWGALYWFGIGLGHCLG